MDPVTILANIAAGEQLISEAIAGYAAIRDTLDAATQAQIDAQVASTGASLDTVRKQLDSDAA